MTLLDILDIPINFIKDNLTGWVILIFAILIIYFIALRKYYTQKERFYDQSQFEQNIEDIENTESDILDNTQNTIKQKTQPNKLKHKLKRNTDIDTDTDTDIDTDTDTDTNIVEHFQNENNTLPTESNIYQQSQIQSQFIATTLFDNLNITPNQIQACKQKYNDVISDTIINLGKLVQQQKQNRFLNTQKQYDLIIAKAIDSIINYLNDTIKSYNSITRTSIRTEVINTLSNVLELLVDKTNNEIINQSSLIAKQDSTTIDYNTQLQEISRLRNQLEEYYEIDRLLTTYSHKAGKTQKEINSILDKSFILPIYEKNYDKIKQLINSDFNDNETNLTDKYSKAYTDFLEEQKKENLNINPLTLASQIESGLVSFITGRQSEYLEQLTNPVPVQERGFITNGNGNRKTVLNADNIFTDAGNIGNYLADKSTQKNILEGFEDSLPNQINYNTNINSTNINSTNSSINNSTTNKPNYNIAKAITNNSSNTSNYNKTTNNAKQTDTDMLSSLMSGDFVQYIMNVISDKLNWFFQYYNSRMGGSVVSSDGNATNMGTFNLENNMIPAGFLLFILSMLFYFIDITS